ncbi:MAG: hypothetical protein GTO45_02510 [Candidatus Aminicenantes bacterium]|nr:hypothetical protein [Candidatus Aminicenantes bacterium]NIM77602.1 hypothetical protein [Candidatus Aminicenantes bacterium]NIN16916.1 hypothetical protein [Candidatus Aminicenantes bacterium]NIN40809.1 hypothetical protein [Candidatus Aminicenantes bacterium]NIN83613.1 hypothetical protein [Candidatus Aminicenantes bacterium]
MEGKLSPPNITIIGAWRTGTTLMFFLFEHGFKDVITNQVESYALETKLPTRYKWRVSKKPNDAHIIDKISALFNPYFIWMLRDPRDCIVSWKARISNYHLNFEEWKRNNDYIENHIAGNPSHRVIKIVYEELIHRPDEIQEYLMEKISGLEKKRDFTGCYLHFDPGNEIIHQLGGIRPFDKRAIGKWKLDRQRIRGQLEKYPDLQDYLVRYGYETDESWQKELYQD